MPAASAAPVASAAAAADAEPAEEKPKEKTIFTVKLEKIDAANKAKIIREVKVLQPSMTLVEVSLVDRYHMQEREAEACVAALGEDYVGF